MKFLVVLSIAIASSFAAAEERVVEGAYENCDAKVYCNSGRVLYCTTDIAGTAGAYTKCTRRFGPTEASVRCEAINYHGYVVASETLECP